MPIEKAPAPFGTCSVCRREARGFGFDPQFPGEPYRRSCSFACMKIISMSKTMIDPTPNEIASLEAGGNAGGEYLDSIGKTDLAALTAAEYATYIEAVVTGYQDRLRELVALDNARHHALLPAAPA